LPPPAGGVGSSRTAAVTTTTVPAATEAVDPTTGLPDGQTILPGRKDGLIYLLGPAEATGEVFSNDSSAQVDAGAWVVVAKLRSGAAGADVWNALSTKCFAGGADCPTASGACVKDTDLGIWGDANKVMALVESIKNMSGVTYINGSVSGKLVNSVPSCAGIVIIRGDYSPNGNQCDFKGVMLILGGSFNGSGGGNTAIRGGVYVANIQGSSPGMYSFGDVSTDISGGGNMSVTYDASFLGGDPNDPFAGSGPIKTTVLAWNDVL
jgi:hypothetical protein